MKSLYGVFGAALLIVACNDSTVAPIQGNPDPTLSDLGTMNVGDVRAMTFSAASGGLSIPASAGAAQFAVILGNSNVNKGTIGNYSVQGDWLTPSVQTPVSDVSRRSCETSSALAFHVPVASVPARGRRRARMCWRPPVP